jgi:hypothetical protein
LVICPRALQTLLLQWLARGSVEDAISGHMGHETAGETASGELSDTSYQKRCKQITAAITKAVEKSCPKNVKRRVSWRRQESCESSDGSSYNFRSPALIFMPPPVTRPGAGHQTGLGSETPRSHMASVAIIFVRVGAASNVSGFGCR